MPKSPALKDALTSRQRLAPNKLFVRDQGSSFFLASIHNCISHVDGGLFVVWAPASSGKTANVRQAAYEWQEAASRNYVVYVNCYSFHSPRDIIRDVLHVRNPTDLKEQLADLEVEVLLILDQFDDAFMQYKYQENHLEVLMLELAQQSRAQKNFRVLVVVRDYLLADKMISWNDHQKLLLCAGAPGGHASNIERFKFGPSQVLKYAEAAGWHEDVRAAVVAAVSKSGNMVTASEILRDPFCLSWLKERIDEDARAWQLGCAYLAGNTRRRREAQTRELAKLS